MEAVILAGGLGTRLRSAVSDVPKPMANVGGKPFLEHLLRKIISARIFTKIILAVGYKYKAIQDYFGTNYEGTEIVYSIEDTPLNTGGAIKKSMELAIFDGVFVFNGDTYFDVDVREMYDVYIRSGAKVLMALKPMSMSRYTGYIQGGVYVLEKSIFENINMPDKFSFEKDLLKNKLDKTEIYTYISDEYFIDIGVPEDYYKLITEVEEDNVFTGRL